ncbi:MAG: metal ABC transporter permease [Rubrimonas sp.]|uniref:metal ABC transporter permease n=1 Tax=Rubrimonas sp. TaxID=2036015 RepID=UPI002FDEC5EB
MDLSALLAALTFSAGYNTAVVTLGAALLGAAAGGAGVFALLRRRALISDALGHATLPGVALAFLAMAALGGDGRDLAGLMLGAALSAALGLAAIGWIVRRTRLSEDAAIGAVLSGFFGLGVVLLTVVQSVPLGRQAGLEGFLLGAASAMLRAEAELAAMAAAVAGAAVLALRRPMTLVAFDEGHAATLGVPVRAVDGAIMALALGVTVIGLKIVGLVLVVALLIVPPVTARFWTDRIDAMLALSAAFGAVAGWVGAALSAAGPALPTGPLIVLTAFALFAASMAVAPRRGALAAALRRRRFQRRAHLRQGLLALGRGEPILDADTLRALRRARLIRRDGAPTEAGCAGAARALRDEARWAEARRDPGGMAAGFDGLSPIETALTADQIAELDRRLGPPREAT